MKNMIFIFSLVFIFCGEVFAEDALYRVSSGEITEIGASVRNDNPDYFSILNSPTFTDGTSFARRVLGESKINDNGTVRNATQEEINGFSAAEHDDDNQTEANKAIAYFQNHPQFRRIMVAYTDILIEYEINKYRKLFQDLETQLALATSLANLQTRWVAVFAANPMPDRDLSQMRTQIINRISKDD